MLHLAGLCYLTLLCWAPIIWMKKFQPEYSLVFEIAEFDTYKGAISSWSSGFAVRIRFPQANFLLVSGFASTSSWSSGSQVVLQYGSDFLQRISSSSTVVLPRFPHGQVVLQYGSDFLRRISSSSPVFLRYRQLHDYTHARHLRLLKKQQ